MNILITGISKGLGLGIAETLLENNHTIFGINRSISDELNALKEKYPDRLNVLKMDLSSPDKIKSVYLKDFLSHSLTIDSFVNNAAVAYDDIVTNLQLEPLEQMFKVNVFTPMMLTKFALRNMLLHHTKGSIVHISSISVHTGYKGLAMYAASKGALEAFSKNTAREWGVKGIRSNCVVAGFMETAMSSKLTDDQKDKVFNRTSLKKPTDIRSVSETVLFLITDVSQSITGQNIFVDSGTI